MYTPQTLHTAADLIYSESNLSLDFRLAAINYKEEDLVKTLQLLSYIISNWFDYKELFHQEIDKMIEAAKIIIVGQFLKFPQKTHYIFLQDCNARVLLAETAIQIARRFRSC